MSLPQHKLAKSLAPDDLPSQPDIVATRTTPDGTCLFNAVSLALVGDETQMSLLCLLVAAELILNSEFYTRHPRITLFSSADHDEEKLFSLCPTRDSDGVYLSTNKSKEDAIWLEALVATTSKKWSGLFHIAALSSVIARPIFSAYPNCHTWIRDFLHSEICPRENMVSLEPLFVLWSRDGNLDNRGGAWYAPNHFVPLYSTGKTDLNREKGNKSQPEKLQEKIKDDNRGTKAVKVTNQRKRSRTLDSFFGFQSSKRNRGKEPNAVNSADEESKRSKSSDHPHKPPNTSSVQSELSRKQEPTKMCPLSNVERPDDSKNAKKNQIKSGDFSLNGKMNSAVAYNTYFCDTFSRFSISRKLQLQLSGFSNLMLVH